MKKRKYPVVVILSYINIFYLSPSFLLFNLLVAVAPGKYLNIVITESFTSPALVENSN